MPVSLYAAHSKYWEKVVVRLFVEGGKHSSTAELVHNHRVEGEKPLLCSFLTSLCFFLILVLQPSSAILGQSTLHFYNSVLLLAVLLFIRYGVLERRFPNK